MLVTWALALLAGVVAGVVTAQATDAAFTVRRGQVHAVTAVLTDTGHRGGPGTVLAECDLDAGRLIRLWDRTDLTVVLQAARTRPGNTGHIHRLELDARLLDRPNAMVARGLGEAVEVAWEVNRLPGRLVAYAVEAADTSLGPGLSPPVSAVVDVLVRRVEDEIVRHKGAAARGTDGAAGP
ncbi:hypothetical protein ACE1SV_04430 [Streptomyces sp. E-15]